MNTASMEPIASSISGQSSNLTSPWTPTSANLHGLEKMQVLHFSNEFPHDDLNDLFRRLHVHSTRKTHHVLSNFIAEATHALRDEVRQLPTNLRDLVPPFESILDISDDSTLKQGPLGAAVEGMLLCVVHIASLIGYFEDDPEEEYDFPKLETCLVGLGTGLLSTAAVSLSNSLQDLPLTGAAVIRITFRLGVVVHKTSRNLLPCSTSAEQRDSWAYVIPDVSSVQVQAELDAWQKAGKIPSASKVFVSAISETSVTISGPPARLKHLNNTCEFFRDRKSVALPVYGGLCHAAHVYSQQHLDAIVNTESLETFDKKYKPNVPVFSTSTGEPYQVPRATELFRALVWEILTQAIQWNKVVRGIVSRAESKTIHCQVLVFRTSLPARDLVASFKSTLPQCETTVKDIIPWIANPKSQIPSVPRGTAQSKIAIVGMACRLPGATDTEEFWDILAKGLDMHRKVPADRFDVDSHTDPTGKRQNTSHTPYGCFIEEPGLFDAPFFNMSPREALQTDPMQRLALVTAYEALERAGYVTNRTTKLPRIGTFYGQASDDYREVNTAQDIGTYFITGGCRAFGPGRINYFFGFSGPSYSIDTACSSGLATIQTACTSLWNGDVDMAVTGGMNVLSNSDAFAGLSRGHFLSKTPNACKTWDIEADGYCRADGIVSYVMKRLDDAVNDNDNILGVIVGAGTNHSADAVSITHPDARAQADLVRNISLQAGIDPLDVSFVEMHGTGTQAGDGEEIQSVTQVFAPLVGTRAARSAQKPLYIGAVKSNIGHGEAVAGPTALLKVLLMMQKDAIPRHVGIKNQLSPKLKDIGKRNVFIPYEQQPWLRPTSGKKSRLAIVNSFSAAGGNTSLAVEDAPARPPAKDGVSDPRSAQIVSISAKSKASLKGNVARLLAYLDSHPNVTLQDLAYTLTARRSHHIHRVAIVASDVAQLEKQLRKKVEAVDSPKWKPVPANPPPIVFAFTGQGASHRSMDLQLFRDSPFFRSQLLELDGISQSQGFSSFIPVVDGSHDKDYAHSPTVTQLALVCTEIALARYWESLGVKPDVVVGHSLGEYAALYVAGVLSASDAIFLVGHRAVLLQKHCKAGSHKMLAVRASVADIRDAVDLSAAANQEGEGTKAQLVYEIACINGPKDTVLSGTVDQLELLTELLKSAGHKCFHLDVAFAFHSDQVDPILDDFERTASTGVLFQEPILPVVSPLLGKVVFDEKTFNATYLRRATREPVDFLSALQKASKIHTVDSTMIWVEIGPHPVCVGLARSILPSIETSSSVASLRRGEDNWQTVSQAISSLHCAGVEINWQEFHSPFEHKLSLLDLPTYFWTDKTYWLQYNGDWALSKGNTFYDEQKKAKNGAIAPAYTGFSTSTVQRIITEEFSDTGSRVVMQSDMTQKHFLAATHGHQMNGCGVATSSIHADIAYTLGEYLVKRLKPSLQGVNMNIANLVVVKGLVAQKNTNTPQMIQVSAEISDMDSGIVDLQWYTASPEGQPEVEPFATARLIFGEAAEWEASWSLTAHLVQGRIDALERLAEQGKANRMSNKMAYLLFGNNLVTYADEYRGMQSIVMKDLEAFADVTLTTKKGDDGIWTVPPHFIDSVAHLAGFVMNVSDAMDTRNNFCVTPGWGSMRFSRPLVAGAHYRSYVKMAPTAEDPGIFLGDVYVMQDGEIMGMVGAIKFRRYPRVLLNPFFSPPDSGSPGTQSAPAKQPRSFQTVTTVPAVVKKAITSPEPLSQEVETPAMTLEKETQVPVAADTTNVKPNGGSAPTVDATADTNSIAAKAMAIVALEAGLDPADLVDDVAFANLGVDSLMSLVIAEKFREQLGVTVNGSLFLEYPMIGDLRAWLVEYYS